MPELIATLQNDYPHEKTYRISYMNDGVDTLIKYIDASDLSTYLDICIYNPPLNRNWDSCIIHGEHDMRIKFDKEYKQDMAKDLLARIISLCTGFNIYACKDIVEETHQAVYDASFTLDPVKNKHDVIEQHISPNILYDWIFS